MDRWSDIELQDCQTDVDPPLQVFHRIIVVRKASSAAPQYVRLLFVSALFFPAAPRQGSGGAGGAIQPDNYCENLTNALRACK